MRDKVRQFTRYHPPATGRGLSILGLLGTLVIAFSVGCRQDMHDQPRYEPLEKSTFFANGMASRPLVEGTVARGHLRVDSHLYEGKVNGELVDTFPFPVTADVLARGQERYNIYCSPCHDHLGYGQGMIVQRGLRPPPSFHIDRLRQLPVGHFYDVITNGLGAMYSYSERIKPKDRWAIIAYIQTLQLSQNIAIDDVPEPSHQKLLEME